MLSFFPLVLFLVNAVCDVAVWFSLIVGLFMWALVSFGPEARYQRLIDRYPNLGKFSRQQLRSRSLILVLGLVALSGIALWVFLILLRTLMGG